MSHLRFSYRTFLVIFNLVVANFRAGFLLACFPAMAASTRTRLRPVSLTGSRTETSRGGKRVVMGAAFKYVTDTESSLPENRNGGTSRQADSTTTGVMTSLTARGTKRPTGSLNLGTLCQEFAS
jgi:hypothetical protein